MHISLVIPAYNESEGVSKTSQSLKNVLVYLRQHHKVEVVFVDDGSKDDTAMLLAEAFAGDADVRVISHGVNRGLGAAIRTGFEHANGDIIVTTDFDGTYSFNTIPQLIGKMLVDNADVVTASPYHPRGAVEGVPAYRLMFSFGASFLYRLLVQWNIHCWTSLFRVYRRPVIKTINFENDGFLAGTELLVNAIQSGYRVVEYPTMLSVRTFGQSSIKIVKVTRAHLNFQMSLLVSSVTGQTSGRKRLVGSPS